MRKFTGLFILLFFCFLLQQLAWPEAASAQVQPEPTATLKGRVLDTNRVPLKDIIVRVKAAKRGDRTDADGNFEIQVPANQIVTLEFLFLDEVKRTQVLNRLDPGQVVSNFSIIVDPSVKGTTIVVQGEAPQPFMTRIKVEDFTKIPNPTGGVEGIVKMMAGVSSNNELSSSYSVRGGSFDENLVYINGIEIYRPQLIRSGEQEGLTVVNPDMVENLKFSAGGFEARYGDKMSSVLDIEYKKPDSFFASASASFLGGSASVGTVTKNKRFSILAGARYRTNKYLLTTLDVQGNYQPAFGDAQSYITFTPDKKRKLTLGWLSYYGSNRYLSVPETQQTTFGTVQAVIRLNVAFQGQELFRFNTILNGLTVRYALNDSNSISLVSSVYNTVEEELYDVIGQYRLSQLENDINSTNFGGVRATLGNGGYLNHGRNRLFGLIYNSELKGDHTFHPLLNIKWGVKYQHEEIIDRLSEYRYVDSADYSIPRGRDPEVFTVYESIFSRNNQAWNRYMGYVQNSMVLDKYRNAELTVGLRTNYWDYNKEMLWSPRVQFSIEPNAVYNRGLLEAGKDSSLLKRNIRFKAAVGVYNQPPFYRELRNLQGQLNPDIRAQKSIQYLAGTDIFFTKWGRTFKWTTEAYYKQLTDIIPYEIDNVKVRYFATNNAKGYATGIDMQLHGQVAKDVQSWVSLSVMKTMEDLSDDSYVKVDDRGNKEVVYPGYIPRPTDQRVRTAFFIQDYLPGHPSYKMHLQMVFGTGLPFGPPTHQRYQQTETVPPYRRVDMGFSKMLFERGKTKTNSRILKGFHSMWVSAELFNMFGINNTVAYLWVKDVRGADWAVPRFLTGRRLNLRLEVRF